MGADERNATHGHRKASWSWGVPTVPKANLPSPCTMKTDSLHRARGEQPFGPLRNSPDSEGSASGSARMKSAPELLRAGNDFTELQCRWINSSTVKSTCSNTGYITAFITVVWIGF